MKTWTMLFFLCAGCMVGSAQTGWHWQNPIPLGNYLRDIDVVPGLAVAVGHHGTILTNSGSGWVIRDAGSTVDLFSVCIEGSGIWAVGADGTILHSGGSDGAEWQSQASGITGKQLLSVFFLDDQRGWIVGELGTILRTTSGGETWEVLSSGGTQHYFGVYFHDENNGWLAGAAGSNGTIKYTTNGGTTWMNALIPASRMYAIVFANSEYGCAVGAGGRIFRTTNGGVNWASATSPTTSDLKDVYLSTPDGGWAVGENGTIIATVDTAANWSAQTSGTSVHLDGLSGGWAVGQAGVILHTVNAGASWEVSSSGFTDHVYSMYFSSEKVGYAAGPRGRVYRTTDGGTNWSPVFVGTSSDLYDVNFRYYLGITSSGYVVGRANGQYHTVFRTADGGATWLDKSFTRPGVGFAEDLHACYRYPGHTFVVGERGIIAHTSDAGDTWDIQNAPGSEFDLWTMDFKSEYVGFAAGSSGTILKTTNRGEDWTNVGPDATSNFRSIFFVDHQYGWVVGVGGVIYRTTDYGFNWIKTEPPVTYERLNSVYFIDRNNGWIAGAKGTVLHTFNGGVDWHIQESGTNNELTRVQFAESGIGWMGGWEGTILHTEDGGGIYTVRAYRRDLLDLRLADPGETSDEMSVAVDPTLFSMYGLSGVTVVLDTLYHTNVSDLVILLEHAGITDTLVSQPTGPGADFLDCRLSDAGSVPVSDVQPPFTGTFIPHSPLSVFSGTDPTGRWTIRIIDLVEGNGGTLQSWGLNLYFDELTSVDSGESPLPTAFELRHNYPNPFNPTTTIEYTLAGAAHVTLDVFNILGQRIDVLVNEMQGPGHKEVAFDAGELPTGVYLYTITAGQFTATRKMLLIR